MSITFVVDLSGPCIAVGVLTHCDVRDNLVEGAAGQRIVACVRHAFAIDPPSSGSVKDQPKQLSSITRNTVRHHPT